MMLVNKKTAILFSLFLGLIFSSCQFLEKQPVLEQKNTDEGYYSISGFLDDQWNIIGGQPYVLLRVASFNGQIDSSYVHLDSTLWKNIRKQFDPSDISSSRFLNQYTFSMYKEDALNLIYLNYEANLPSLFTRKLNVGVDNLNHKIRTVFIETRSGNRTYEKAQKLTYIPHKLIRIQSFEKSVVSKPEELMVSYYFDY